MSWDYQSETEYKFLSKKCSRRSKYFKLMALSSGFTRNTIFFRLYFWPTPFIAIGKIQEKYKKINKN